eukprot:GFKZ01012960.1.p2 GENE.GFKZ01012960.1~~GFKZ01012960.1.p2  ORF type:complete len:128 (+),score=7.79 GFKZ01012960.1:226-609(+)
MAKQRRVRLGDVGNDVTCGMRERWGGRRRVCMPYQFSGGEIAVVKTWDAFLEAHLGHLVEHVGVEAHLGTHHVDVLWGVRCHVVHGVRRGWVGGAVGGAVRWGGVRDFEGGRRCRAARLIEFGGRLW